MSKRSYSPDKPKRDHCQALTFTGKNCRKKVAGSTHFCKEHLERRMAQHRKASDASDRAVAVYDEVKA